MASDRYDEQARELVRVLEDAHMKFGAGEYQYLSIREALRAAAKEAQVRVLDEVRGLLSWTDRESALNELDATRRRILKEGPL